MEDIQQVLQALFADFKVELGRQLERLGKSTKPIAVQSPDHKQVPTDAPLIAEQREWEPECDNLWSDQNLEADPDLPPGWRTIRDTSGTYYWHVPTGTTQWQHPMYNSGLAHSLSAIQEKKHHQASVSEMIPARPFSRGSLVAERRPALHWNDEDLFHNSNGPDCKSFAVHCLGWVEIPEEDLAPGKSSITVNNCIQQLAHTKCDGIDVAVESNEGQNMVMVLKKDTMSLVDPLDHSLIHSQPIINIRVWGVGCNNGRDRDFAFVANDKDTCMLKCHVFRCDVPAKAIASALHEMCSKIMSERAVASNAITRSVTLETISPEDLPLQVGILEAVRESVQKYEVLYLGSLPVSKPMGMDVLNETIKAVTSSTPREHWKPAAIEVTDILLTVHQQEDDEGDPVWQCEVRYVTFMGIGKDPHTFALIVDVGKQCFQCTVFWCEPDAGNVSEAVQAACMVQYQKCLVTSSTRVKSKAGAHCKSLLKMKRTASVDSPISPFSSSGHTLQKGAGTTKRRGVLAFFESFKQKHVTHTP
ncbi:amyloid-beta A4 precursor protein-binding family B member 3 [Bombina bombina]|uniref:amyloid-beta A4 precursor protein-binding family B member 3 n=1 Tax=Bombina bombina TaxID=8345 RepID=UPI00235AF313|nr:amyloid-beta A4 precursor protein-binding family B member 3 [Bombina bombina]